MKNKHGSLLAEAAGFIADVWTQVDKEARKLGATNDDIYTLVTERDKRIIREIAKKFAEIITRNSDGGCHRDSLRNSCLSPDLYWLKYGAP